MFLGIALMLLVLVPPAHGAVVEWNAASGSPPDSVCPAWTKITNGGAATFIGDVFRIATTSCSQNVLYLQSDTSIAIPDTLVLEARLAVDQGTECVGPCGHYRQVAALNVTTAPHFGSLCFVAPGEVMLVTNPCGAALTAAASTSGMHTYRVRIVNGTSVTVYQAGVPLLSGSAYTSASDHSPTPRVLWGDGSSLAWGTTRWEWVRHNAHADGCATTSVTPGSRGGARSGAAPNPFRRATTLHFTTTPSGSVRVVLYDIGGRRVRQLESPAGAAGARTVEWDGLDSNGRRVRPGTYYFRTPDDPAANPGVVIRIE